MGGELDDLPEPIIQHILSFFSGKEAAQTALLSKSWRKAWLTRPNLAFEGGCYFDIWELATKTIQRYEESNLKIQSLTIRVSGVYSDEIDICNELIAKSLELGATHLNLDVVSRSTVSQSLVFGSSSSSDRIVIRCSGLESLCLTSAPISLDTLSNILSSCPSIRKLSLSDVRVVEEKCVYTSVGLGLISLGSLTRLELLYVDFDTSFLGDLSTRFPSLTDFTLHTSSSNHSSKGNKVVRISSRSIVRLNFAQTGRVKYKFDVPRLRMFTYEASAIPLLSIKTASTEWESRVSIECGINLAASWFRELSEFLRKLRGSKLHVSLDFERCWACFDYEAGEIQGLRSSRRARVENLTVELAELANMNCYALFDGLFQVCRPKVITQYLSPVYSWADRKVNSTFFLCKAFLAHEGGMSQGHFLYHGLRDLEEVSAEILDDKGVWRHVPLKSLLDIRWETDDEEQTCSISSETEQTCSISSETDDEEQTCSNSSERDDEEQTCSRFEQFIRLEQKIRFQLKWKH